MAYQVDKFNGTFLVSVDDGTIDTTTDLRFVGKNYAGYGEVQNENFLHLMENFANTSAPSKVITGQIWYDSGNKKLKFYDGIRFKNAGGAEVSTSAPSGLAAGEFWWDSSAQQLYTWTGDDYVLVGPESAPDLGTSSIVPQIVKDSNGVNRSIAKLQSGGDAIAIISKDAFTLNSVINPITGFSVIKKGFTLINTNATTGVTSSDHYFWGTSSNALKLGGYDASAFTLASSAEFASTVIFKDNGFTVGDGDPDLRIKIENGDEPVIENLLGNPIKIRIRVSESNLKVPAIFSSTGIAPGATSVYTLGTTGSKWLNVYADEFTGPVVGNLKTAAGRIIVNATTGNFQGNLLAEDDSVLVDYDTKTFLGTIGTVGTPSTVYGNLLGTLTGTASNSTQLNYYSEAIAATASTIALRDSGGNLTATRFIGTADKSNQLLVGATYRSTSIAQDANTVAARTSSGDLVANVFQGTATSARYADLAEKYLADAEYDVGTVVSIGGEKEITAAKFGDRALGAVSANPAYMMNSELEGGTYVALKGRVPVKVAGSVKKGDRLVATANGCAIAATLHQFADVFAIALETNSETGTKLVEAVIL